MIKADVAVAGLGAYGAATLYQLARAGVKAVGIDRFAPPHDRGSSHGDTRITRAGVAEGDVYAPFAVRSHAIWRELESETCEQLYLDCGVLIVDGAPEATFHGKPGLGAGSIAVARGAGIAHSVLSPSEAMAAFPQFCLAGHETVYFEPGGGLVFPERCIAAQLARATALGARTITGEIVATIRPSGSGVEVVTESGTRIGADRVVVATGGWAPGMSESALSSMRLLRQTLHWFEPDDWDIYAPARCPAFIWTHGPEPEQSFYGFPAVTGTARAGVKVATEQYTRILALPEEMDRNVAPQESAHLHAAHLAGRLPGLTSRALHTAACFYTAAPDGDFVIDFHPGSDRIVLVSACSGHGFKHSAGASEHIAGLITGESGPRPEFGIGRLAVSV
jgi:sarcosine oxidase